MADRTSAEIFGRIFEHIAERTKRGEGLDIVGFLWKLKDDYDFREYQMSADDALLALGLARRTASYFEGYETIEYEHYGEWF